MDTDYTPIDDAVLDEMASRARARASTPITIQSGEQSALNGEYVLASHGEDDTHFLIDAVRRAQQAAKAGEAWQQLHEQATIETEQKHKETVDLRQTNGDLNVTLERVANTRDQVLVENRNLLRALDLIAPHLPDVAEDAPDSQQTFGVSLTAQEIRQIQMARDPNYYARSAIANRQRGE